MCGSALARRRLISLALVLFSIGSSIARPRLGLVAGRAAHQKGQFAPRGFAQKRALFVARIKGNFSSIASLRGGRSIFPHLAGKVI